MNELSSFKFWCQKVLPLVYDDSLSYYEVLCKITDYINKMLANETTLSEQMIALQQEVNIIQQWIADFDTSYAIQIIKDALATMIFVEISPAGFFMFYVPEKWSDITFNTTELDIHIPDVEYGRLVLSY